MLLIFIISKFWVSFGNMHISYPSLWNSDLYPWTPFGVIETHNRKLWSVTPLRGGSATQSCLTLSSPMDCSIPGVPVLRCLLEFAVTHIHWIGDAIQPSHPLSSPFPPVFNLSRSFPADVSKFADRWSAAF